MKSSVTSHVCHENELEDIIICDGMLVTEVTIHRLPIFCTKKEKNKKKDKMFEFTDSSILWVILCLIWFNLLWLFLFFPKKYFEHFADAVLAFAL